MAPVGDIQRETFTEIYRTYSGRLYGVCLHYVRDHEIASDLLHDSFIVIFSSLDQLRDRSRLVPWMCSIVRNIALKHLRDSQRMPETSLENIPEPSLEDNAVHITDIPLNELLKVIDELPEQYGKVFRLSVLDGLSHKEIGEILGIAPHSSSSNLSRAKQMLRKVVSKNWGIILTFCLCIAVILFTMIPEEDAVITSDNTMVRTIPTGKTVVMMADLPSVKSLKLSGPRTESITADIPAESENDQESALYNPTEPEIPTESETFTKYENIISDIIAEEDHQAGSNPFRQRISLGISTGASGGVSGIEDVNPDLDFSPPMQNPGFEEPEIPNRPVNDRKITHSTPIVFNISAKYSLTEKWAITTGLQYTYLHSDITEDTMKYAQDIHYLGIPVKASWTFWSTAAFAAYASAGTTVEFPLACRIDGKNRDLPCQWSAGLGMGLQYNITRSFGIYIEPELNRYFDNGSSISTIRTDRPLTIIVPVGIRFSW